MKRLRLFSRCFYHVRARPWPTNDVNRFLSAKSLLFIHSARPLQTEKWFQ